MYPNYTTYHVEKMLQYRQEEWDRKDRSGLYTKEISPPAPESKEVHSVNRKGRWVHWFANRRLHTS